MSVQGVAVDAVVGDSVILMCSASRSENGVFWQHENTKSVYDIIDGKENLHDQDAAYKGRVNSFPSEFSKGNYSITLRDVKLTDAGSYSCSIPNTKPVYVELRVEGVYGFVHVGCYYYYYSLSTRVFQVCPDLLTY